MKTEVIYPDDIEQTSKEIVMLERLIANAYVFYRNPKNEQAFQAWKNNKETEKNGADNVNA